MNVDLTDILKKLKISFNVSVDSIAVSKVVPTAVNSVNVTAKPGGKFKVDIDAITCKVWAKWFAVTGAGTVASAANPFENDTGTLFINAQDAPISPVEITPDLHGNDTVLIRVWSLDNGAAEFGPIHDGRAHVCSSSSSSSSSVSSSSSSSPLSSGSSNTSNSSSPSQSSNSTGSSSSTNSGGSTSSASNSSTSSNKPPTSSSSATSSSSRSSGPTPTSSSNSVTHGKSAH